MAKAGMSATDIGNRIGEPPRVVNRMLEAQGLLEGAPGAWKLTPKGEQFGVHVHFDNGLVNNTYRGWDPAYYDPTIFDVLDTSPDQIAQAHAVLDAERAARAATRKIQQANAEAEFLAFQERQEAAAAEYVVDWKKVLIIGGAIAVTAGGIILVRKYGPTVKKRWRASVSPRLVELKDRVTGKTVDATGSGTEPRDERAE